MLAQFLNDLFMKPIPITGAGRLGMLVPLALSISLVYKTIRCERISQIPGASLYLCFLIVSGMLLIGGALFGIFRILA
jgi:hypothetical protein